MSSFGMYDGLAFICMLTLIPTKKLLEGMVQALARVCVAWLARLREVHFVLAGPMTDDAHSFQSLISGAMNNLCFPHPLILRAYDVRLPNLTLTWPQLAGVGLEYSNLTLDPRFLDTHNLRLWAHNSGKITAVTISDVIIDLPVHWRGVYGGLSVARRLVFRRTQLKSHDSSTPAQVWATYWETLRALNVNLEELVFEGCGYVYQDADGKSFVPLYVVPPSVLERDAGALRDLRASIAARALM
jgi:hypothetical protein